MHRSEERSEREEKIQLKLDWKRAFNLLNNGRGSAQNMLIKIGGNIL
jgi:hypothetical protein